MTATPDYASKLLLAWQGKLDFFELLNFTSGLEAKGLHPLAAVAYQTWLKLSLIHI